MWVRKLIQEEGLNEFQIYNADEMAVLVSTYQEHLGFQGHQQHSRQDKKKIKERFSILACANSDGSHRLS